jgi:hypothetical protein
MGNVGDCFTAGPCTELEFVQALNIRLPGTCLGPGVALAVPYTRMVMLEDALREPLAIDFVWDRLIKDEITEQPLHAMCAAHWLDIASLVSVNARGHENAAWAELSSWLLINICRTAGWDPKEVSNLFIWRRVPLT